ncbi:UNVERIFIED_CONTAM: hypothetical protein Sindi_0329000 [Sesamum indicum]
MGPEYLFLNPREKLTRLPTRRQHAFIHKWQEVIQPTWRDDGYITIEEPRGSRRLRCNYLLRIWGPYFARRLINSRDRVTDSQTLSRSPSSMLEPIICTTYSSSKRTILSHRQGMRLRKHATLPS